MARLSVFGFRVLETDRPSDCALATVSIHVVHWRAPGVVCKSQEIAHEWSSPCVARPCAQNPEVHFDMQNTAIVLKASKTAIRSSEVLGRILELMKETSPMKLKAPVK